MIRVLLMIAVAGFVLSVGAISAAVAIGGPEAVAHGGWSVANGHWRGDSHWDWDDDDDGRRATRDWGPESTRTLTWSGADTLDLDLAADVRYIQQAGPATVTITGPTRLVDHVMVRGDTLKYEDRGHHTHRTKLAIVVRAPNIQSFDIAGRNTLVIEGYRQPRLRIDASGAADVTASGEVDDLELDLSGNADAELGALKTRRAEVDIAGSSDAVIAPTDDARLEIAGNGEVRLLTSPKSLSTDVSGSGRVRHEAPAIPTPPPAPTAPPSPSPKASKS
jgi:hypothetical protein